MSLNDTDKRNVANLAVANANLHIAILKDDPAEVLKALSYLEQAQILTQVSLYNLEQICGMRSNAMLRIENNKAFYVANDNAPNTRQ